MTASIVLLLLAALVGALIGTWIGLRLLARPPDLSSALAPLSDRIDQRLRDEAAQSRRETAEAALAQRQELAQQLQRFGQLLGDLQRQLLEESRAGRTEQQASLARFGETQAQQATQLRTVIEDGLKTLRQENTEKLEQMRRTVDEKLHETLEKRLGESFKLVSDRLEQVHKGLGEMQGLASGVGDLKRVLTNVKTRGGWGEVQLQTLLEQLLTPAQFSRSVRTRPGSDAQVDFAIRLPGQGPEGAPVWLPLDAKFPREDYERLLEAIDRGDAAAIDTAGRALEAAVKAQAKSIRDKYVEPPHTTDFALMFLPTEGLYAEVLRRPGLADTLQRDFRISVTGPTTLTALLNSLQMGFRTLAIEKRSSEVWQVLGAVKTEFGKFGETLARTRKQLETVTNSIGLAEQRTRVMSSKLRTVEALPGAEAEKLIGGAVEAAEEEDENP